MNTAFISLAVFVLLLAALVALRVRSRNTIDIRSSDIVLALLPVAFWLLLTGQVQEFGFGELKISAAIQKAAKEPVDKQVSKVSMALPVEALRTSMKGGQSGIEQAIADKSQALSFTLGSNNYYPGAIMEYLDRLTQYPYLRYLVLNNPDGTFFGLADARQVANILRNAPPQPDSPMTTPSETNPPETNATITNPPVTNPAETNATITNPPVTNPAEVNTTEVNPPMPNPAMTNRPVTSPSKPPRQQIEQRTLAESQPRLSAKNLADWLNKGKKAELETLPGFIAATGALLKTADRKQALQTMNKLDVPTIPVVDEKGKFFGTIDRSKLTASILTEIAAKVDKSD